MKKIQLILTLFGSGKITFKAFVFGVWSFFFLVQPLRAQLDEFTALPQERELYNTIPGSEDKGSILDTANPMELMNLLRRATSMDDATSPSDAVDEALRSFELEGEGNSSLISDY